MIYKIECCPEQFGNTDSFKYIAGIEGFPHCIEFKPGINVLCGSNGSGKTTLLNVLRSVMLCQESFYSEFPSDFPYLHFKGLSEDMKAFKVLADYRYVAFNFRETDVLQRGDTWCKNTTNATQTINDMRSSRGQAKITAFNLLFGFMFGKNKLSFDQLKFPLEKICEFEDSQTTKLGLSDYYNTNQQNSGIFTLLLDEPDNNLDIFNMKNTFYIYSVPRPDTQIIVSLHNPLVLYRLSVQENPPNFIELTPGYIKSLQDFVLNK